MGMHMEAVLKMAVRSDIFWSQIQSGFGEPGGTPSPRIPMRPHPSPLPPPTPNCTALISYRQIHTRDLHILRLLLKPFMPSSANFNS